MSAFRAQEPIERECVLMGGPQDGERITVRCPAPNALCLLTPGQAESRYHRAGVQAGGGKPGLRLLYLHAS